MRALTLLFALAALPAAAETLVAARTVRAQAILTEADLAMIAEAVPGALSAPEEALGLEARTMLYQGRPIRPGDVGPAAIVERNALVVLVYRRGGLVITAEGRALGRGGPGDSLRVMNLASRTTVTGTVASDGRVIVGSVPGS
ncbi:MAG: flagellar basal body P-ring formation chaperone FlgA [Paracoccaceae bacterium]|nr:flagellar basal body P-ring formation chaperone FlgA [Paracoccaceae bacterium]